MTSPALHGGDRPSPVALPLPVLERHRGVGCAVADAHEPLGHGGSGRQPHALAVHPGGRWESLSEMASNTLAAASERLPPGTPTAIDVTPDGRLLAIDAYEDDRVTVLGPGSLDVVARVQTGASPHHPQFSTDGRVCYGPSTDGTTVTVLDTASPHSNGGTAPVVTTTAFPDGSVPSGCFRTDRSGFQ